MADNDKAIPSESLASYKQNIDSAIKTTLVWEQDLVFTGSTPQGCKIKLDSRAEQGCKPMEALLLSLAGCMGMDIMAILTKMRTKPSSFRIEIEGMRNSAPPQYYKAVRMVLHLSGKNMDARKLERAIALSRDKYCSVYQSLRPDMSLDVRYVLEEKDHPPEDEKAESN